MEYRPLEVTLISAEDLKDVNLFSKLEVYAVVYLFGDSRSMQISPTDSEGRKNPNWNFTMKFNINENMASQNRLILMFQLRCQRNLGDREVGEVHVPIKELLDNPGEGKAPQFLSYQLRRPSGRSKGVLNFSYKIGENVVIREATKVNAKIAYPPQHKAYPPPAGGYPPPPQIMGVSSGRILTTTTTTRYLSTTASIWWVSISVESPHCEPPKKNKPGGGLGLLGGALNGLLIRDMVSDSAYLSRTSTI